MRQQMTTNLLSELTDDINVQNEILAYAKNKFVCHDSESELHYKEKFVDESFVNSWHQYLKEAETIGVFKTLQRHLVPLQFPVSENISKNTSYRSATLQGKNTCHMAEATGLELRNSKGLELQIYDSLSGKIPILIVDDDKDFKSLIQALCHKNEPVKIPDAMGAAMINGLNNWSKINELKNAFLASNIVANWPSHFKNQIIPNKSLYQDKIIILSKKPYSNVTADAIGCNQEDWIHHSLQIRLEHECAHYFTLRNYGIMANNMHDELIADYVGICASYGRYNPEWFLKFIGLEEYPNYRKGARLENYLGNPKLSKEAFEVLKKVIYKAVNNIHKFDSQINNRTHKTNKKIALICLCSFSILDMAHEGSSDLMYAKFNNLIESSKCITKS